MELVVMGILAAVASMVFFGSFAVPMKTTAVLDAKMDPIIFQSYKSFVCFMTSWLVLIYTPLKFTWWGMVGALIWVITGSAAVLAVRLVGIGLAQSLWSSLSIVVAYIWGAYIFKESIQNHALSLLSVFIMVMGMLGVGFMVGLESKEDAVVPQDEHKVDSLNELDSSPLLRDSEPSGRSGNRHARGVQSGLHILFKGIGLATVVGVLNGSFLIPLKYAHEDVVGIEYLVSFGVGSMAMTLLVLGIYWCSCKTLGYTFPSFKFRQGAGPALLTGLLWSLGNYLSIYATLYLGYSIGWPLVQCQLLVSALWAVLYYKEVKSKVAAIVLIISSLVLVGGAVMLSYFGTVG
ncbi:hypothetical protein KP509_18G013500 [Ceratopteris richardii]|uniref:Uncharacterized protein n=1 Tax=Ceratopteris richardii TaxID=49495 RepID=A0A8T2SMM7_CERRI|nr:hypothetical protein KP509_18G013500 [Ceratopteris richardii]